MTIFCINIGDISYGKYSLPIIKKLCEYNNINLFVLDKNIPQNIFRVHPSWLKLFCHQIVKDDFIISWDLDLVPTRMYNIKEMFDTNKINLSYDGSYLKENFTFNGKFKYNCGLLGIPKNKQEWCENIYHSSNHRKYPSYEQYHINDSIYDNKININVLDNKLNKMYDARPIDSNDNNYNIHYTWKTGGNEHKRELIEKHCRIFVDTLGI
jgi:hypothetical protein